MDDYFPLTRFVKPLLLEYPSSLWRFSRSGSCFLLMYRGTPYAITASHVIREHPQAHLYFMLDLDAQEVECAPARQPFTFVQYENEDFQDFLVAPIDRTAMDAAHLGLFFPYTPVVTGHFRVSADNHLIVIGYPDERAEMDVEPPSVSFQALLAGAESATRGCDDMMYRLVLGSDCGLSSFSGLSGAPVPEPERSRRHAILCRNLQVLKSTRQWMCASCWHMNDYESAAMWRLYAPNGYGIAVQTTLGDLKECFHGFRDMVFIGSITYVDFGTFTLPPGKQGNIGHLILHKRMSFKHENELRAFIVNPVYSEQRGKDVPVDVKRLLKGVFASPASPVWHRDLAQKLLTRHELPDVGVQDSEIDGRPTY